jgi:Zn-dependent protease
MGRIHLGTILGTTISLDVSFIFLIVVFILMDIQRFGPQRALLWAPVLLISLLFHELAHAAMIASLGFGPSQIVLEGIGGVTINERQSRPWHDILIFAAGPASSFLLAWGAMWVMVSTPLARTDPFFVALLPLLYAANWWWGLFNLLPVIPLDGSGILRNFLRLFLQERLAFTIAVWTSMIVGALVGILGLVTRQIFLTLLMMWYVRSSYMQWDFFKRFNKPNE